MQTDISSTEIFIKTLEDMTPIRLSGAGDSGEDMYFLYNLSRALDGRSIHLEEILKLLSDYKKFKYDLSPDLLKKYGIKGFF